MADKTLLILYTEKSIPAKGGVEVDDIAGIIDGNHFLTSQEREIFRVVEVEGNYKDILASALTETKTVRRLPTTDWTDEEPGEKQVWKDDAGNWRELAERPHALVRYEAGVIKENFSRILANTTKTLISAQVVEK